MNKTTTAILSQLAAKAQALADKGWKVEVLRGDSAVLLTARKGRLVKWIEVRQLKGCCIWRTSSGGQVKVRTIV